MPVLRMIPRVSLRTVSGVRGPGLVERAEQYRKLVPFLSISSTRTLSEKARHSAWKYLIPPSGMVGGVISSPGSITAGAVRDGQRQIVE